MTDKMDVKLVEPEASDYPAALRERVGTGSPTFAALGNLDLLHSRLLGLFCSIRCPGDAIIKTYDLVRALRDSGVPVIGGFHAPMEKECLTFLLRGIQPVVVCPARSVESMRVPSGWKTPLAAGRLLVLSPLGKGQRRATVDSAQARNLFVAALAEQVFVPHAGPGSKTEVLCRQVLAWGKPLWTLDTADSATLLSLGARPLRPEEVYRLGAPGGWSNARSSG